MLEQNNKDTTWTKGELNLVGRIILFSFIPMARIS